MSPLEVSAWAICAIMSEERLNRINSTKEQMQQQKKKGKTQQLQNTANKQ